MGSEGASTIDRAVSMLRLLLGSASEDELSRAQALGALLRCPLTMTTRIGVAAPRLTKTEQGELSATLFTGSDALEHAAKRFGWGELDLEFGAQTLPGVDALRRLLDEGVQKVAVDPGAAHAVELLRDEIEVLVSKEAERPSAAMAKRARREGNTHPIEREDRVSTALAEIDDPFAGKEDKKPPKRAPSKPLPEEAARKVPRNMESEPFASVRPQAPKSSKPPKKGSTKRPPRNQHSGPVAARRVSPVDDTQPFETERKQANPQPVIVLEGEEAQPAQPPQPAEKNPRARAKTAPMTPHAKSAAREEIAARAETEPVAPPPQSPPPPQPAQSPQPKAIARVAITERAAEAVVAREERVRPEPKPNANAEAAAASAQTPAAVVQVAPIVRSAEGYDFGAEPGSEPPAPSPMTAAAPEAAALADKPKPPSLPTSRKRGEEDDDRLTMPEMVTSDSLRAALERAELEGATRERLLAALTNDGASPTVLGAPAPVAAAEPAHAPEPAAEPAPAPAPDPPAAPAPAPDPPAAPAPARSKPQQDNTVTITAELLEPEQPIEEKPLRALADALRLYPEVEWACHVSDGEEPPLIGVRIEPSFLKRSEEIAQALHGAGGELGVDVRVFLLTDAARMREARAKGNVFFPWRSRDPKRETKQ